MWGAGVHGDGVSISRKTGTCIVCLIGEVDWKRWCTRMLPKNEQRSRGVACGPGFYKREDSGVSREKRKRDQTSEVMIHFKAGSHHSQRFLQSSINFLMSVNV